MSAEIVDENAITIYTDGSSYPSPRSGGVGILFVTVDDQGDEVVEEALESGYKGATNNQMELQACVDALALLKRKRTSVDPSRHRKIVIRTDSTYVCENFRRARFEWSRQGWRNRDGRPVANAVQWKALLKLERDLRHPLSIEWVKGHKSSVRNKRADKLAKASAKGHLRPALTEVSVRRKMSERQVEVGCVRPRGQRLTIRIITQEWQSLQRLWKFKYEVMSKRSPESGFVDILFGADNLRAGHTYYVQLNNEARNPRIAKVFREIVSQPLTSEASHDTAQS